MMERFTPGFAKKKKKNNRNSKINSQIHRIDPLSRPTDKLRGLNNTVPLVERKREREEERETGIANGSVVKN